MNEQQMVTCPTCGTQAPVGASFCGNCGASLAGAGAARPATPVQPAAAGVRPAMSESESRNWALAAHLTAVAGVFIAGLASFVGPLVVWLIRREDDPFAAAHALEALNFNLTTLAIVILGFVLGFGTLLIGFVVVVPLLVLLGIVWVVWTIQGAMAASRGEPYRYPVSVRLIKD